MQHPRLSVRSDSDLAYARSSERASQPRSLHHHAFEHSEFSTIMLQAFTPSTGQTTHRQKPGPAHRILAYPAHQHARPNAPKPIHPDKEHFAPDNKAGSKHPNFLADRPL
jgi:hypothetical protein